MNCACGHPEKDHVPRGRCRVPDCPCELFRPGDTLGAGWWTETGAAIRRPLAMLIAVLLAVPALVAAERPAPPTSFAPVAQAALAASIVVRVPDSDAAIGSIPAMNADDPAPLLDPLDIFEDADIRAHRVLAPGIIVDPRGFALTSARAVVRAPAFEVTLLDGTPLEAALLGVDTRTDIALLKIDTSIGPLAFMPLAEADRVRVGEWVVAIGAPIGLAGTVTAGIITATPNPSDLDVFAGFLQTDAAMGRGNAGGPIVSQAGEIVGLSIGVGTEGVGYARPATTVRKIYQELLEKGRVSRASLGITTQSLTPRLARALGARGIAGVLVADVLPGGPAAAAGLRSGDIVVAIATTPVSSRVQLDRALDALAPGRIVRIDVRRAAEPISVRVKLGEAPDDWQQPPLLERAKRLLGLEVAPLLPTVGVVAASVERAGPAERAGLAAGDIVRELNRRPIRVMADFLAAVRSLDARTPVLMLIQRGDVALYVAFDSR